MIANKIKLNISIFKNLNKIIIISVLMLTLAVGFVSCRSTLVTKGPQIVDVDSQVKDSEAITDSGKASETNSVLPVDSEIDWKTGWFNYQYDFKSDLSAYEQYMNPKGSDYLELINSANPLSSDYVADDMINVVDTRGDGRNTQQLRLYAEKALEALLTEGRASGVEGMDKVSVTSAYRSYSYQDYLFNYYISDERSKNPSLTLDQATAKVLTYSCRAGESEHQSGLSVDMHNLPSANRSFGETAAGKWLAENSYKFGYILRFPADKIDKTNISYEPWHFRYVGRYHATRMHDLGMCLDEYVEYLNS